MEKLYFANKVIQVKDYLSYAKYYSDQLGCNLENYYFLDNQIYVFKLKDGKYIDLNDNIYEEINLEEVKPQEILWCNNCEYNNQKNELSDCKKHPKTTNVCIGITNMKLLTSFLEHYDNDKVMEVIDRYNSDIGKYYTYIQPEAYSDNIDKVNKKVKKYLKK